MKRALLLIGIIPLSVACSRAEPSTLEPAPTQPPATEPPPTVTLKPTQPPTQPPPPATPPPPTQPPPTAPPPTATAPPPTEPPPTVAPPPTPLPPTEAPVYSSGSLDIPQTWTADLDGGGVGAGSDADIWFHAVTGVERYVEPQNGAVIAIVGMSPVGRDGCAAAPLSTARIHVDNLPAGTYVCVLTNMGRYSEFRVNAPVGPSPGMLSIYYTTWW